MNEVDEPNIEQQGDSLETIEKPNKQTNRINLDINWGIIVVILCVLLLIGVIFRKNIVDFYQQMFHTIDKPIIYLYPEKEKQVSVKLLVDDKTLICTYPQYDNGWVVNAKPDGTLYTQDGKEYSYLFWEAESYTGYDLTTGFIVKGSEAETFLQEKLSYMGLIPKEYNEFIVYWLPKLEANEYNLIHFAQKEYTDEFPLKIEPQPDSILRVFMVMKAAKGNDEVQTQTLELFERKGFAVIEWGGTELGY